MAFPAHAKLPLHFPSHPYRNMIFASVLGETLKIKVHEASTSPSFTVKGYGILVLAKVKGSMKGVCFASDGYGAEKIIERDGVTISFASNETTVIADIGYDYVVVIGNEVSFSYN